MFDRRPNCFLSHCQSSSLFLFVNWLKDPVIAASGLYLEILLDVG